MSKNLYIDQDINILVGEEAKEALKRDSDKKYYSQGKGVDKVPKERWQIAQSYEKKTWMEKGIRSVDDRNFDHMRSFQNYESLKGLSFENAIELGCGPFTNLRIVTWTCQIKQCTLLDPLADEYLSHPNAFYNKEYLYRDPRVLLGSMNNNRFVRGIYRYMPKKIYGRIPVKEIISKPIEEMSKDKYDLIIMLNVLEHCYDLDLIFEKVLSIVQSGAYFVFQDKYHEHSKVLEALENTYDAGHPLRFSGNVLDDFLEQNFSPIFQNIESKSYIFNGEDQGFDVINFIGQVK